MWIFKADFRGTDIKCYLYPLYFLVETRHFFFHVAFLKGQKLHFIS